jgi:hypothetical protein
METVERDLRAFQLYYAHSITPMHLQSVSLIFRDKAKQEQELEYQSYELNREITFVVIDVEGERDCGDGSP